MSAVGPTTEPELIWASAELPPGHGGARSADSPGQTSGRHNANIDSKCPYHYPPQRRYRTEAHEK